MKKFISLLLIISLLIDVLPLESNIASAELFQRLSSYWGFGYDDYMEADRFRNGDYEYVFLEDDYYGPCAVITAYLGNDENVIIPSQIEGYNVKIGLGAFSYNQTIKSVTIPETVFEIGPAAFFGCKNLEKVIFVDEPNIYFRLVIENGAFCYCTSLKEITLPTYLISVGSRHNNGNIYYEYNGSTRVFEGCSSLQRINITGELTEISEFGGGVRVL